MGEAKAEKAEIMENNIIRGRCIWQDGLVIEEYWEKVGEEVFRNWKFPSEEGWRKELTPYKEIPFVIIDWPEVVGKLYDNR